jgi:hypothetical protein
MLDVCNPIDYPSPRRLHRWGIKNIGGLAAPILPPLRSPRANYHGNAQQCVANVTVQQPSIWPHRKPNELVMKHLCNVADNSPRLRPFDRTMHQTAQDVLCGTSYQSDYSHVATSLHVRALPGFPTSIVNADAVLERIGMHNKGGSAKQQHYTLSPRLRATEAKLHATKAGLDPPYHPSKHGAPRHPSHLPDVV